MDDSKFTIIATLYVEKMATSLKYVCAISNDYAEMDDDEKMRHLKALRDMFKKKVKQLKELEDRDND